MSTSTTTPAAAATCAPRETVRNSTRPSGGTSAAPASRRRARAARVGRRVDREHEAHGGERAEGVPVRERLVEPRPAWKPGVDVDDAGQQARGERVAAHDRECRAAAPARSPAPIAVPRSTAHADHERRAVERRALHVGESGIAQRRPQQGQRAPGRERREPRERHPPGAGWRAAGAGSSSSTTATSSQASALTSTPDLPVAHAEVAARRRRRARSARRAGAPRSRGERGLGMAPLHDPAAARSRERHERDLGRCRNRQPP